MSQPVDHDPYTKLRTRPLVSQDYVPELGDYAVIKNQELSQRSQWLATQPGADFNNLAVLSQKIVNERNSNNVRLETTYYPRRLLSDGSSGNGTAELSFPIVTDERILFEELEEFVDRVVISKQLAPLGGSLDASRAIFPAGTYRQDLARWGPGYNLLTTYNAPEGYQTRTSYETDPETGCRLQITRSVVTAPGPAGLSPAGVSEAYKQVGPNLWIKTITQQLDGIGDPIAGTAEFAFFTYNTRQQFEFPAFVRPFNAPSDIIRLLNGHNRTLFDIRIRTRRAFSTNVWAKKTVSYSALPPPKPTVFEWRYVDWMHDGTLYQVHEPNVLANATTIAAITLAGDTYYGGWNESVDFPASIPTADAYIAQIGIENLVDVDVTRVKDRVYRKIETRIVMS